MPPPIPETFFLPNLYSTIIAKMSSQLQNVKIPVIDGLDGSDDIAAPAGNPGGLTVTQKLFKTAIPEQPVTQERRPFLPTPESVLQNAGTARATLAASREKPNGTVEDGYAGVHQNQTVFALAFEPDLL